jgi:hypothetical protein
MNTSPVVVETHPVSCWPERSFPAAAATAIADRHATSTAIAAPMRAAHRFGNLRLFMG